jgi:Zn-dependent M28 family amino/carboxypeptidase
MRELVEALCSERCAGRAPGTIGGREGRRIISEALTSRGLEVIEQPVPGCAGANLLAAIPAAGASAATTERWVLLGAHHDHLGRNGGDTFWGADDNAAAVAILVELAAALARQRPVGRGVLIAFFDGEEPPHFLREGMGSAWYAAHPPVPLDRIDMMVCMDLVGHAIGGPTLAPDVRATVFVLGAERSEGTAAHVDAIAVAEPGVRIRRLDAEVLPPVSDYAPFWRRGVPFAFLTAGRAAYYHTPDDTPDKLDYPKMAALARWLQRWTRETCARPEPRIRFQDRRDDAATARTLVEVAQALEGSIPAASALRAEAEALLERCDASGHLPASARHVLQLLLHSLEASVA